ncbi:AAA family ATPase [Neomicrococcus lactis]
MPVHPRLVVIAGLPGVGKTSVAAFLATLVDAVHLSIDAVEESLLASGFARGWQTGVAAYEAGRAMAELNLHLGRVVVVDAVNDSEEARETWRRAAVATGASLEFVHLILADVSDHQRRLEGRDRGFAHVTEPLWSDVQRRRHEYAPWTDPVLEIDTSNHSADQVAALVGERLALRSIS